MFTKDRLESTMMRTGTKFLLALGMLGSVVSCTPTNQKPPPAPTAAPTPEVSYLEHTIARSGETLGEIAAWYTGKGINWTLIRDANPGLKPDRLRLGQTVLIPRYLVVNERPFIKKSKNPAKTGDASLNPGANGEQAAAPEVAPVPVPANPVPADPVPSATEPVAEPTAAPTKEVPVVEPTATVTPAPTSSPIPAPTAAPLGSSNVGTPSNGASQPAEALTGSSKDIEREKLLDELLK